MLSSTLPGILGVGSATVAQHLPSAFHLLRVCSGSVSLAFRGTGPFSTTTGALCGATATKPAAKPSKKITVTVNGTPVTVEEGVNVLAATSKAGVYVPTLCKHPRLPSTPGTCRLCLVEVDGRMRPACAFPAEDGMKVETKTQECLDNVKGVLTLLRANHPDDCMTCDVNGRCEFQDLITRYKIPRWPKLKEQSEDYQHHAPPREDQSSHAINLDRDKCIKCGRCVTACTSVQNMNVLGMLMRNRERHVGFVEELAMDESKCIECGQCVSVCPVGAISEKEEWRTVMDLVQSGEKIVVVQTAPAVRVAIGEELGLAPGSITIGALVAGLRQLGFKYVFDTDFSADLTIMEEGTELLQRLGAAWNKSKEEAHTHGDGDHHHHAPGPLPMFTSCCPAWVNMVEKNYPELGPHLSTAKSPQQMLGAVIKNYWTSKMNLNPKDVIVVSVMPCTAKKHEAARPEMTNPDGVPHVDYVVTTRELGRMFRANRIPVASLPDEKYDSPLGESSGAAVLFGNSGGVMEAAVRTVYEIVTGQSMSRLQLDPVRGLAGIKEATLSLQPAAGGDPKDVRIAVASGIANARLLIEKIRSGEKQYDFVEVMSCPGGCIGGGGQPKTKDPLAVMKRMNAVYDIDEHMQLRKSHENKDIQKLYAEYLGAPCGEKSHELLHTTYGDRSHATFPAYSIAEKDRNEVHMPAVSREMEERRIQAP